MFYKTLIAKAVILILASHLYGSSFLEETYNALGGDAATDELAEANNVLSYLLETSKTKQYRAVVQNGGGSATWIGNSASKSYFLTVGHVINSASSNILTNYQGVDMGPVEGSVFYRQDGDFGLLEYNGVLDPELFGGTPPTLMDNDLVANYLGYETALVGYGNITLIVDWGLESEEERKLGRSRMLSYANITGLDAGGTNIYRTRSGISDVYDPLKPYAGVGTSGDSGGGVFLTINGEYVLVGANAAGNGTTGMVYTNIHVYKTFINSVVPPGVITWYSESLTNLESSPEAVWSMNEGSGTDVFDAANNGFDATAVNATWVDGVNGKALDFNGSDSRVDLPAAAFATINKEVTISMWVYGDDSQPRADSVFYASDSSGNHILNIYLPWSNGEVYWDAGFSETFDRIQKAAIPAQYEGQWNHWAFVKNATTGTMEIYLNGALFHSDGGKTKAMSGITQATFGGQISALSYDGIIDEVSLYNTALNAGEIFDLYNDYINTEVNGVPTSWLLNYGIAGTDAAVLADTDGDGISNLMEYVLDGDPTQIDHTILPQLAAAGENYEFTYTRRADSVGNTTQVFQYTSSLGADDWTDINIIDSSTNGVEIGQAVNGRESVSVTFSPDLAVEKKIFVRLKVLTE